MQEISSCTAQQILENGSVTAKIQYVYHISKHIMASALLGTVYAGPEGTMTSVPAADLDDCDVIGLYFSAHWCPPCKAFTPQLVYVSPIISHPLPTWPITYFRFLDDGVLLRQLVVLTVGRLTFGGIVWSVTPSLMYYITPQLFFNYYCFPFPATTC